MNSAKVAERFLNYNFHDALLKNINIQPARNKRSKSSVEVNLEDYDTNELIHITFKQPGNVSFIGDFNVLLDNAGFGNTNYTKASTDLEYILKTINKQKKQWNVTYHEGVQSPIEHKISSIKNYVAFKINFHGGTLEVVAKDCRIIKKERANNTLQRT
jgi:hypothetical protein